MVTPYAEATGGLTHVTGLRHAVQDGKRARAIITLLALLTVQTVTDTDFKTEQKARFCDSAGFLISD